MNPKYICALSAIIAVVLFLTLASFMYLGEASYSAGAKSQSQSFTANGTFTVPSGVTTVWVTAWGGGGAGAVYPGGPTKGNGGGGGEVIYRKLIPVSVGQAISIEIGKGGIAYADAAGGHGTNTTFLAGSANQNQSNVTAEGGFGGTNSSGGRGGGIYGGTSNTTSVSLVPNGGNSSGFVYGGAAGGSPLSGYYAGGSMLGYMGGRAAGNNVGAGGAGYAGEGQAENIACDKPALPSNTGAGGGATGTACAATAAGSSGGLIVEWIG